MWSRFAPVKLREANSVSGTIGETPPASMNTNTMRQPKPTIKLPKTRGCLQPRLTDSMNPLTKPPNPIVTTTAPNQSTRAVVALRLSGIRHNEMDITAAASGRLMRNAQRQDACSTSQPPRTGPIAAVIAVNPDHVPIACPRLFSSNDALIIARLPGRAEDRRLGRGRGSQLSPLRLGQF